MPHLTDYQTLVQTLASQGIRCVYHQGGAFEFESGEVLYRGWVGSPDPTIRPALQTMTRVVGVDRLADATAGVFVDAGRTAMVMPTSHWAHELEAHPWLVEAIGSQTLDCRALRGLNRAEPIAYSLPREQPELRGFVDQLLNRLSESDFSIVVPGVPLLATIHHHRQVWWRTNDAAWLARIDLHVA